MKRSVGSSVSTRWSGRSVPARSGGMAPCAREEELCCTEGPAGSGEICHPRHRRIERPPATKGENLWGARGPCVPSSGALPSAPAPLAYTASRNAAGERGAELFPESARPPTHSWAAQCFSYQLGLHIAPPILEVRRAATIPNKLALQGDALHSPGTVF